MMNSCRPNYHGLKRWRQTAQTVFLFGFLLLFQRVAEHAPSTFSGIFFQCDPLIALSVWGAAKQWIPSLWPAIALVILTLISGRFFCGWVCPLGTLLDVVQYIIPSRFGANENQPGFVRIKLRIFQYILLFMLIMAALLSMPWSGYLAPFALLTRGMTFAMHPGMDAGISLALLGVVFALEFMERRFWCRYVCPTGALLGLIARWSWLRRLPLAACQECTICQTQCRMAAMDDEKGFTSDVCIRCMDCQENCPRELVHFTPATSLTPSGAFSLTRRHFFASLAGGAALPVIVLALPGTASPPLPDDFLRPPGVGTEQDFIARCIRCGLCMKTCPTDGLQPAWGESGIHGVFSPRFIMRIGYCQYDCVACGRVCPTGAIPLMELQAKQRAVMGKAHVNTERCLPYVKGAPCQVCEKCCPIPQKAIHLKNEQVINERGEEVTVALPYVKQALCTGCGICETKCPVPDPTGIRVFRR